ncbi:hypothetical protein DSM112329_01664 [Paraconexibacter sp. AEG42_29]|uniref:Uncharacterized protein n=1 Tax=Paraconexibacter sp. AEG42_29 TaxID=2997339 RepID=A0AAU7AT99_9ACTN
MSADDDLDPQDPLGLGGPSSSLPDGPSDLEDDVEVEVIDVVTTVGPLDTVVVTLREFLHRSGAVRALTLLPADHAEDPPHLIDCARLQPIEVVAHGRTVHLPHAITLDAEPLEMYDVRQLPPFEVKADEGQIAAPLGGVEHYGFAVRGLARALGPGAVALVTFATNDVEAPLSLTARDEDPIVLSLGEEEYEMDPGWPETLQ